MSTPSTASTSARAPKRPPHWTQDPTRCTTTDYRYEVVLTDAASSMIDGDYARTRASAFARGEHWLKREPGTCVAVYDRMARVGQPYEWRFVSLQAAGPGWVVTKLRAKDEPVRIAS